MKAHTDRARKGAILRRALAEGRHLGPGKRRPLHGGRRGSGLGEPAHHARVKRVWAGSLGKGESQSTSGASEGGDRDVRGSIAGYVAGRQSPPFQSPVVHRSDQGVVKRQDPRACWVGSWKRQKRNWAIDELPAAKAAVTNREPTRRECSQ